MIANRSYSNTSHRPGILLAEDEPCIRMLLNAALAGRGFEVYSATHGDEAVRVYAANSHNIDLVLLDGQMPGKTGLEAFEEMKNLNPSVRCCLMTGNPDLLDQVRCRLDDHLLQVFAKPFSLNDMLDTLFHLADGQANGTNQAILALTQG